MQKVVNTPGSSSALALPWSTIWKLKVPMKVRHFAFRLLGNTLPCQAYLAQRGVLVQDYCVLCGEDTLETPDHIFLQCEWTWRCWFLSELGIRTEAIEMQVRAWLEEGLRHKELEAMSFVFMILWAIWKQRNGAVFEKQLVCPVAAVTMSRSVWWDWRNNN